MNDRSSSTSDPEKEENIATEGVKIDDDDDGWDEDDDPAMSKARNLDDSLEYQRPREEFFLGQKVARRKFFNKNRGMRFENIKQRLGRNSISSKTTVTVDDWSQFQSCSSLKSTESANDLEVGPKKTVFRNFMLSNHSTVDRMSDIHVPPARMISKETAENPENLSLRAIIIVCFGLIAGLIAIILTKDFRPQFSFYNSP